MKKTKQKMSRVGKDMEQLELPYAVGGSAKWTKTLKNCLTVSINGRDDTL